MLYSVKLASTNGKMLTKLVGYATKPLQLESSSLGSFSAYTYQRGCNVAEFCGDSQGISRVVLADLKIATSVS